MKGIRKQNLVGIILIVKSGHCVPLLQCENETETEKQIKINRKKRSEKNIRTEINEIEDRK